MNGYERVTYCPEGARRARTVLLHGVRTSAAGRLVSGTEVGLDGEIKWTDGGTTSRTHVIESTLVIRREPLVMDKHYGVLVTAKADEARP